VGSRAATAYGAHVATELAAGLGVRGWTVVSGGA
jgi:DNA processing protein